MTFKDLQKLVQSQSSPEQSQLLERLKEKPFWIWDQSKHRQEDIKTKGDCCFDHIIGLPRKEKEERPLFDYQKLLYDSLLIPDFYNLLKHTFKLKHLWVRKATLSLRLIPEDLRPTNISKTTMEMNTSQSCFYF